MNMAERRKRAELGGIADENIELGPAVGDLCGKLVDLDEIAQVKRDERGAAAGPAHSIIGFFETSDSARNQNEMRPLRRKARRDRRSDAARCPGDQCNFACEPSGLPGTGRIFGDHGAWATIWSCLNAPRRTAIRAIMLRPAVNIR